MMADASDMLAAALEQMDGIIAGIICLLHQALPYYFINLQLCQQSKMFSRLSKDC